MLRFGYLLGTVRYKSIFVILLASMRVPIDSLFHFLATCMVDQLIYCLKKDVSRFSRWLATNSSSSCFLSGGLQQPS